MLWLHIALGVVGALIGSWIATVIERRRHRRAWQELQKRATSYQASAPSDFDKASDALRPAILRRREEGGATPLHRDFAPDTVENFEEDYVEESVHREVMEEQAVSQPADGGAELTQIEKDQGLQPDTLFGSVRHEYALGEDEKSFHPVIDEVKEKARLTKRKKQQEERNAREAKGT